MGMSIQMAKRVIPTCSCAKCGRTMLFKSFRGHERKSCPVRRSSEILELPGEESATEFQRRMIRELYHAKVVLPMPPELVEQLEVASYEAADRLIRWLRRQKPIPGRPDAPKRYQSDDRVECPQCGLVLNRYHLKRHMERTCLGSREAREVQEVERARKQRHKCPHCGRMMTPCARQDHLRINCPVTRLSAFLERVGRTKATREQRREIRELYARCVEVPMPRKLDEVLEGVSSEVAEQITCWLRRILVRSTEEKAE
jgi:phage FluMu protein Com